MELGNVGLDDAEGAADVVDASVEAGVKSLFWKRICTP